MLCGHCADISRAICPHYILLRFSALVIPDQVAGVRIWGDKWGKRWVVQNEKDSQMRLLLSLFLWLGKIQRTRRWENRQQVLREAYSLDDFFRSPVCPSVGRSVCWMVCCMYVYHNFLKWERGEFRFHAPIGELILNQKFWVQGVTNILPE